MTEHQTDHSKTEAEPRQVSGDKPGDYGIAPVDPDGRVGAGEGDPIDKLTAPLDPDDDVHERIALVNTEAPDRLEQAPGSGCTDGR